VIGGGGGGGDDEQLPVIGIVAEIASYSVGRPAPSHSSETYMVALVVPSGISVWTKVDPPAGLIGLFGLSTEPTKGTHPVVVALVSYPGFAKFVTV
jgi:hypothetical protein